MTTNTDVTESHAIARPLWLELRWQDGRRVFEFGSTSERVVMVGTQPAADVRIERPGISPVELHFERDGRDVCVVPAYQSVLTLNAVPVSGIARVRRRAIIEFSGVAVEAIVHDEPPLGYDAAADHAVHGARYDRSYVEALPDEADTTRAVLPSASHALEPPTANLAVNAAMQSWPADQSDRSASVARTRIELSAVVTARPIIAVGNRPSDPAQGPITARSVPAALETRPLFVEHGPPPSSPMSPGSLRSTSPAVASLAAHSIRPAIHRTSPETVAVGSNAILTRLSVSVPNDAAREANAARMPRTRREPHAVRQRRGWLTELGLFTKRRPLAVTVAALWSAMILALALTGLNSVIRDRGRASSSQRSRVMQTGRGPGHPAQRGVRASETYSDAPR